MESRAHDFSANATRALQDPQLQKAMGNLKRGFIEKRRLAADRLPEFDALRDQAREGPVDVPGREATAQEPAKA